jgi:hypothetical protein
MSELIEGTVVFSNLVTEDIYRGKPVGYSVTLELSDVDASFLADNGVKVKTYVDPEGKYPEVQQRKFKTNSKPRKVVDVDDMEVTTELPRGTKVRVAYAFGEPNPEYGVPCYLNALRVLEMADMEVPEDF